MIIDLIDKSQSDFVNQTITEMFGDAETKLSVLSEEEVSVINEKSISYCVERSKYIKISFRRSGRLEHVNVFNEHTKDEGNYYFHKTGYLDSCQFRNLKYNQNGRLTDGLRYTNYNAKGEITSQDYVDPQTGILHSLKHHAKIISQRGKRHKEYWVYGEFVGIDLDLSGDPEPFLKNFVLLK